jgi:hypothetical protein
VAIPPWPSLAVLHSLLPVLVLVPPRRKDKGPERTRFPELPEGQI